MSKHVTYYFSGNSFDRRSVIYNNVKRLTDAGKHVHVVGRKIGRLYWNCDCAEVKK